WRRITPSACWRAKFQRQDRHLSGPFAAAGIDFGRDLTDQNSAGRRVTKAPRSCFELVIEAVRKFGKFRVVAQAADLGHRVLIRRRRLTTAERIVSVRIVLPGVDGI